MGRPRRPGAGSRDLPRRHRDFPSLLTTHATALWVAAGLLGLPHGALDVLVLVDRRRPALSLVRLAGYAVLAVATIALVVHWPGPTVAVLLVLSVAHFAEGERANDVMRDGRGGWRPGIAVAVTVLLLARLGPAPALVLGLLALTVPHAAAVTRLDRS